MAGPLAAPQAAEPAQLERWWEERALARPSVELRLGAPALGGALGALLSLYAAVKGPLPEGPLVGHALIGFGLVPLLASLLSKRIRRGIGVFDVVVAGGVSLLGWLGLAGSGLHVPADLLMPLLFSGYGLLLTGAVLPTRSWTRWQVEPFTVEAIRQSLAKADGPDQVLLLASFEPPRGCRTFARLDLWEGKRPRVSLGALVRPDHPHGRTTHWGAAEVTGLEAERLVELCQAAMSGDLLGRGFKGLRCTLHLLRRDGPDVKAQVNLAGLSEEERRRPVALLAREALKAARRAVPEAEQAEFDD